jgi:hypothetical protein
VTLLGLSPVTWYQRDFIFELKNEKDCILVLDSCGRQIR